MRTLAVNVLINGTVRLAGTEVDNALAERIRDEALVPVSPTSGTTQAETAKEPVKPKRGRPRKNG